MADAFDEAWEVAKGDFFFGGPFRDKRSPDYKGVRTAKKVGHDWIDEIKDLTNRVRGNTLSSGGMGTEHATFVKPPQWTGITSWSKYHADKDRRRPWRALNLSEYGRKLPKDKEGYPEIRGEKAEMDIMQDMFERDTHEAMHEAIEYPVGAISPDYMHEYGAIAGQSSLQRKPKGIRRLLGLPARDDRKKRFKEMLRTHPDTKGRIR